ncbi:Uma2 family endonuclease [Actinomadura sp. LD22]|uniref:Uma2 family endonuclease n=1 Tax=Actinomadura physcomitrii TaxID=2650748 RepID=A0A6I4M2J3_9ACTN|nr:Uma2 family endonuclease [Actinomadura physcomitrii]MVZ99309.1 Uma2 family endonuclease [Actinomadura physcomitrii]
MPLPSWAADPSSLLITEEEYRALPSEVCKSIEVVDGCVIFRESPSVERQRVLRNLTCALMDARPGNGPRITVVPGVDMYFVEQNPHAGGKGRRFTMRRPDISVLFCVERGTKPTSADVLTAVEITGLGSGQRDFQDKKAEYAGQRISVYLIVVLDAESSTTKQLHYEKMAPPARTGQNGVRPHRRSVCTWATARPSAPVPSARPSAGSS